MPISLASPHRYLALAPFPFPPCVASNSHLGPPAESHGVLVTQKLTPKIYLSKKWPYIRNPGCGMNQDVFLLPSRGTSAWRWKFEQIKPCLMFFNAASDWRCKIWGLLSANRLRGGVGNPVHQVELPQPNAFVAYLQDAFLDKDFLHIESTASIFRNHPETFLSVQEAKGKGHFGKHFLFDIDPPAKSSPRKPWRK